MRESQEKSFLGKTKLRGGHRLLQMIFVATFAFVLIPTFPSFLFAQDEEELFSDDGSGLMEPGPIASGPTVIFSGLLDARFVQTGKAISWTKGGRGLTRYGGKDTDLGEDRDDLGDESSTSIELPQASLAADIIIDKQFSGFLQINYDDHNDTDRKSGRLGLVEAYIKYKRDLSKNHSVENRFGLVIPPISLEHPNVAWSTEYTITPSAINTWYGEEIRVNALELNYRWNLSVRYTIDVTLAPFSGNDPAGSILAWRGWALHDYQLTTGNRSQKFAIHFFGIASLLIHSVSTFT